VAPDRGKFAARSGNDSKPLRGEAHGGAILSKKPCIAIIPAKAQSERFPNKNRAKFMGTPLWRLACQVALGAEIFSQVVLSSDDMQTYNEAGDLEVTRIMRPHNLSRQGVSVQAVTFHVLSKIDHYDGSFAILLPTSPLRTVNHLTAMWNKFLVTPQDSLMSIRLVPRPHEYFLEMQTGRVAKIDAPEWRQWWIHDGTAIFCRTVAFLQHFDFYKISMDGFPIPREESVDVNTEEDLAWAEFLAQRRAELVQL